jgi:predicted 2-oxoglutarate/Fe(II)-dependent dioxygenase YbiX
MLSFLTGIATPQKEKKPENISEMPNESFHLSPLNADFDPSRCVITEFPEEVLRWRKYGKRQFAIIVENVLTPEECDRWIAETEVAGYGQALVNIGNGRQKLITDIRNNSRCMTDDEIRADELWNRIKYFIPQQVPGIDSTMIPRELGDRLRFLRYDPGEYFAPHCDGCYPRPENHSKYGDVSHLTFQLYLNENFEGGTTRFYYSRHETDGHFDIVPKKGLVCIFDHQMYHSGEMVTKGRKYAMRTDVMFTPVARRTQDEKEEEVAEVIEPFVDEEKDQK